jgi:hypothetical protein
MTHGLSTHGPGLNTSTSLRVAAYQVSYTPNTRPKLAFQIQIPNVVIND